MKKQCMMIVTIASLMSAPYAHAQMAPPAGEVLIKDKITGVVGGATNSLNNQTAGVGGRQILLTQHVFTDQTEITRFFQLSSSTAIPVANGFSYSVRALNSPFTELFSGVATRTNRSVYTDVTLAGNNTNLDEFSISGLTLDPGTYYIAVHASDGNAYQVAANSAGPVTEPLLAENGGVPFLAGANFHLYTQLYGIVHSVSTQSPVAFQTIPANTSLVTSAGAFSMSQINQRLSNLQNTKIMGVDHGALQNYSSHGVNLAMTSYGEEGYVPSYAMGLANAPQQNSLSDNMQKMRFWSKGHFTSIDRDTTTSFNGYDGTTYGGQIGFDIPVRSDLAIGFAYGHTHTDNDFTGNLGGAEIDSNHISIYGQRTWDNGFYANMVYSYEMYNMDLRRDAGVSGIAVAFPDAFAHNFQIGGGYKFPMRDKFLFGLEAVGQYADINVESYRETGAGAGNLNVAGQDTDNYAFTFGGNVAYDAGKFVPQLGVYFEHSNLGFDDTTISLVSNPANSVSQSVKAYRDNAIRVDLGFDYLVSDDMIMNASYATALFNDDVEYHDLSVSMAYRF